MNCASSFNDADFPGFRELEARENLVRAAACLGINETICGCEVRPLTAFHTRRLSFCGSPFQAKLTADELCADETRHGWLLHHVMLFLWIVSPFYRDGEKTSAPPKRKWWQLVTRHSSPVTAPTPRDQFNAAFAPVLKCDLHQACKEILDYVEEAYLDAGESESTGDPASYYAFEIAIAEELHRHYPGAFRLDFWNPECPREKNPLHIPLKLVFQLRKARAHNAGETPTNASAKLIAAGLAELGRKRRRTEEYERDLAAEKYTPTGERYTGADNFDYGLN